MMSIIVGAQYTIKFEEVLHQPDAIRNLVFTVVEICPYMGRDWVHLSNESFRDIVKYPVNMFHERFVLVGEPKKPKITIWK